MELARRQVEQHRLVTTPLHPRQAIEQSEQRARGDHSQPLIAAGDLAHMDLAPGCVEAGVGAGYRAHVAFRSDGRVSIRYAVRKLAMTGTEI